MFPGTRAAAARRPAAHGSHFGSALLAPLALLLGGCGAPTPIAPVSPSVLELTPVAGLGGTVYTATPTPGPSPTPTVAATVDAPPPEGLDMDPHMRAYVFAEDLGAVWGMAVGPGGDLFVTVPEQDRIWVLPDRDGNGRADAAHVFHEGFGLNRPYGIAFRGRELWVANTDGVARFDYYEPGDLAAAAPPQLVVPLPAGGRNPARSLAFDDEGRLYVGVGASCNACIESDPRLGAVLRFDEDGGGAALYSRGLRDPAGIAIHPGTGEVYVTDKARDDLGDDGPPEELNRLVPGGDFGWPACHGFREGDPRLGGTAARCAPTIPPALAFAAHSAPIGAAFYDGEMFPEDWQGDLLVTSYGSTMRRIPFGHKIMRVPFEGGQPTGEVFDLVTGWLRPDTRRWGRPVDLVVAPDGALLMSDEAGERIYRFTYAAPTPTATPPF